MSGYIQSSSKKIEQHIGWVNHGDSEILTKLRGLKGGSARTRAASLARPGMVAWSLRQGKGKEPEMHGSLGLARSDGGSQAGH